MEVDFYWMSRILNLKILIKINFGDNFKSWLILIEILGL